MAVKQFRVDVNTDGSGDGSGRIGVPFGRLVGVQVNYGGTVPATCDVTLAAVADGVTKTLLTLTDRNTDLALATVHEAGLDNVGAAVAAGKNAELVVPVVGGNLTVTVAQGGATITNAVGVIFVISF